MLFCTDQYSTYNVVTVQQTRGPPAFRQQWAAILFSGSRRMQRIDCQQFKRRRTIDICKRPADETHTAVELYTDRCARSEYLRKLCIITNCYMDIDCFYVFYTLIILIIIFICKAPYIRKYSRTEEHKIHCDAYILKIFIISLNLHVKTK